MIATLTAIMYILSVADETYNNKTVQKGSAISRINSEDGVRKQSNRGRQYTVVCKKNDNCLNLSGFNMSNLIKVYDISF